MGERDKPVALPECCEHSGVPTDCTADSRLFRDSCELRSVESETCDSTEYREGRETAFSHSVSLAVDQIS